MVSSASSGWAHTFKLNQCTVFCTSAALDRLRTAFANGVCSSLEYVLTGAPIPHRVPTVHRLCARN